jgi:CyaY protein
MAKSETEFLDAAERLLAAVEAAVEACAAEIETTRTDNVLTLELEDGSKIIVNSQAPTRQIWVAARSGGFHYELRDGAWRDTRDGTELFAALSRLISAQAGVAVVLRAGGND